MPYEQVVALIGTDSVGPISTTDGDSTSEVYTWMEASSAGKLKVAFQQGKVVWKSQFKLE
jgi:hypothetical protein